MYIKKIKLSNYRNFEKLSVDFGRKATVFIGKNGVGKTNIITALKQSLSFIFSKNTRISQYEFVADSGQKVVSFQATDARYGKVAGGKSSYIYPVMIETEIDIADSKPLAWRFERRSLSEGMRESYANASIAFWEHYSNLKNLPVIAFFSDSYPHIMTSFGKNIQHKLESGFELPANVGYYKWDDEKNCNDVWQLYYLMQWKNSIYNNEEGTGEYIKAVKECLIGFSQTLPNTVENRDFILNDIIVEARGKEDVIVLIFNDGRRMSFESLPQGYRRVFSIVFDIANRSYIMNHNCNPDGVVFIDEIELHLHPSLAQEILERYRRAFPKIQWIVSTHSPLVLSNFMQDDEHIVYGLSNKNLQRIENVYGIDYNSLLYNHMETPIRNSFLRELQNAYLYWKEKGDKEKMQQVLNKIIEKIGKDNVIVKQLTIE